MKYVYNDAGKPESYVSMVEEVINSAVRIDVLVNNFGTSNPGKDLDFRGTDTEVFFGYRKYQFKILTLNYICSKQV